jgi:hypothetical protein
VDGKEEGERLAGNGNHHQFVYLGGQTSVILKHFLRGDATMTCTG